MNGGSHGEPADGRSHPRAQGSGRAPALRRRLLLLRVLTAGAALARVGLAVVVPQPIPQPPILLPQLQQLQQAGARAGKKWRTGRPAVPSMALGIRK